MFEIMNHHVHENLGFLVLASQGGDFTFHGLVLKVFDAYGFIRSLTRG